MQRGRYRDILPDLRLVVQEVYLCPFLFASGSKEEGTEIYFLNYKPEIAEVYENEVKPAFEAENPGYVLKVVTAASNQYQTTLRSELAKSDPPVIFQVNGFCKFASQRCLVLVACS